jgi:hypothetical protein
MNTRKRINNFDNVWMGLIGVIENSLHNKFFKENGSCAYVNYISIANDYEQFIESLNRSLDKLGLVYFEIENIDSVGNKIKKKEFNDDLKDIVLEVLRTKEPKFTTFHTFIENN